MGKSTTYLTQHHKDFIASQKVFFVATSPLDGFINLSPKGVDSFRIIDDTTIVWLNLTGSGNETAAHLLEDSRMTIMMNAFEGNPMIHRLYGEAKAIHQRDAQWESYFQLFTETLGARQIIEMKLEKVMTSCGFGVPVMEYNQDRTALRSWAEKKRTEGLLLYHKEKNVTSLNGKPTGLFED
ncbi:MAG: hypothetical protein ACI9JN_002245 [Bacteroidia bacterium]|jgi:hypothetical protein